MKTLVLGLGNSILSDDGVGLHVAAELRRTLDRQDINVLGTELGGLNLLELLVGYECAIIVDAIKTANGHPGQIYELELESLIGTRHTNSTHGIDFANTVKLGKKLGMSLPEDISILAIEAADINSFSEYLTYEVNQVVPRCVELILQKLKKDIYA